MALDPCIFKACPCARYENERNGAAHLSSKSYIKQIHIEIIDHYIPQIADKIDISKIILEESIKEG